tara:strand:+ start:52 stop:597 length:546 start_codon:yes stop_codon:yes gene_type:complete
MLNQIYKRILLSENVVIDFKELNSDLVNTLTNLLKQKNEGICIIEGFVKPDSIKVINYSTGELYSNKVSINIAYECYISNPAESDIYECIAKSITKVGIRAEINNESSNPAIVFIARDHHHNNELFSKVKENDIINIRVIGKRYELNDKYISIIAELIEKNKETIKLSQKSYKKIKLSKKT